MSKTAVKTHRVVCDNWTHETTSEATARAWADEVESAGNCLAWHTVEVKVGDEWVATHVAKAREILAAKVGTVFADEVDGALTKTSGSWSKESVAKADAAGVAGSAAWTAALGAHETAVLTSDGRGAKRHGWCACGSVTDAGWVRYEAWSARGREAHGWVHGGCRFILQSG